MLQSKDLPCGSFRVVFLSFAHEISEMTQNCHNKRVEEIVDILLYTQFQAKTATLHWVTYGLARSLHDEFAE